MADAERPLRVLLVAFYFPPAGGGGVQRVLKLCRYLPEHGVEVHVLAPDDPRWLVRDEPALDEIAPGTRVHRARFLGPQAALRGDVIRGLRWPRRALAEARFAGLPVLPDRESLWLPTPLPAALCVIRRGGIQGVVP